MTENMYNKEAKIVERNSDETAISKSDSQKLYEEIADKMDEFKKEEQRIFERDQWLRKSIEDELRINRLKFETNRSGQEKAILELLEKNGYDALIDVDQARLVYEQHWHRGVGSSKIREALRELMKDIPYSTGAGGHGHAVAEDNVTAITVIRIAIPRGADIEKLDIMAEKLAPILRTQHEIAKGTDINAKIDVFEQTLSEYGNYGIAIDDETGEFYLQLSRYHTISKSTGETHKNLRDVLDEVAKKRTYGATEEYSAQNPGWDDVSDRYESNPF